MAKTFGSYLSLCIWIADNSGMGLPGKCRDDRIVFRHRYQCILALGFFVSWLLGRPVVRGYQVEKLGEEKASHPVMVHMASRMSVMFTIAFSSAALISAIWPESDWAFLICNLILGGALLTAYKIYPAFVKNNTDEIAALYEDEIAEWEAKHPEINFAGELA